MKWVWDRPWRGCFGHGHPKPSSGCCAILHVAEDVLENPWVFMSIFFSAMPAEWIKRKLSKALSNSTFHILLNDSDHQGSRGKRVD